MARTHGRFGALYMGVASSTAAAEPLLNTTQWEMDFKSDKPDVTCLGDTNKVYVAGLPDASGSFAGFWDTTNQQAYTAASDGVARRFYAYPSTPSTAGPYWYGTAFFDMKVTTPVEGAVAVTGTFMPATAVARVG